MLDLLTRKTANGDLYVNLANHYLKNHEWGLARKTIVDGIAKGCISESDSVDKLFREICTRMAVRSEY